MDNKKDFSRREFLRDSAVGGAGLALVTGLAPVRVPGANDRIRVGALGTGERAQYLMTLFKAVPSTEVVAVCDVYEPHRDLGLRIAGPDAKAYVDYREVLDLKDVDAVIIGAPDHWHKTMLVDAVRAGKDVYCEKPIMHSIEQGVEMVRAVEETRRVVQTGMQQRSWNHYQLGKHLVDSGKLGRVTFVHTYWYQNYYTPSGWNELPAIDTSRLDWKKFLGEAPDQPFTPEKFVWWRFFWDFGGGILTDLLTHWIDVIQWYMGEPAPKTASATGDLYLMKWQCPDTITAVYEFPGDFVVTYTGAMNSGIDDGGIEFRGSAATMKIDRSHLAVYPEGAKYVPGQLAPEPEIFVRSEGDGTVDHVMNFLECMRSRKTPNAPIQAGFEAARTSWIGNMALRRGMKVAWGGAAFGFPPLGMRGLGC
ncbi:MAG: gfo/Idh/MocA family oxidoreductase [Acidobacteria bacterium]|nr:MAG: gfo/Idh/MocA family oxidoreductase [Acidobacteriota bacterium]